MQNKYESAVEKAAVAAFKKEYERIHFRICLFAQMCRNEGLLSVKNCIDKEKAALGNPLDYSLLMALDGMDRAVIEKYLDSWIEANSSSHCEYYDKILFSVIKNGVLSIQSGLNPHITAKLITAPVPMELMPDWTEFYPEGVKQYGWMLNYVPEAFRTKELCYNAVKNNGDSLRYVPEKFKTKELCAQATEQNGCALQYVPEEFKTEEFCHKAVEQDGRALDFVPKELKTQELCLKAVKQYGYALKYVPEEFKTEEFCRKVIEQDGRALEFVPEKSKTAELCLEAVKQNEIAFKYVPKHLNNEELNAEFVKFRNQRWKKEVEDGAL
ncbi:MAG: DUF4116 domain-containing protein [Fibromonadaceae bacterium]|jgi:hypothetical protein|nr:DUF4116 domain-containing protein [Fibromonadaceae bacterium]